MNGTIMNSKRERQTLTTRYLRGRGGEGVCYVCGCHFSNSSFQCKTDLFDAEGLLLELSKGNVRVEIPASFLNVSCKLQSSP